MKKTISILLQKARLTYNTFPFYGTVFFFFLFFYYCSCDGVTAKQTPMERIFNVAKNLDSFCSFQFYSVLSCTVVIVCIKILISYFSQVQVLHSLLEFSFNVCVFLAFVPAATSVPTLFRFQFNFFVVFSFNFIFFFTYFRQMSVFGILSKSVNCFMMALVIFVFLFFHVIFYLLF